MLVTRIGTADGLTSEEFKKKCWSVLPKHANRAKKYMYSRSARCHFENKPTQNDVQGLEDLKFGIAILGNYVSAKEYAELELTLFTKYVYGTTAIEGNTYTEEETHNLIFHGLSASNKALNDTKAIFNYIKVRKFVRGFKGKISQRFIKKLHSIMMQNIKDTQGKPVNAGKYRQEPKGIEGVGFSLCPPDLIEERMQYLIEDYYDGIKKYIHPVELAAKVHQRFEEIHPFQDGNGRTGRELLNLMLHRDDFPEIYIPQEERD